MTQKVSLHLGAHRTGTTALQMQLARSRAALAAANIAAYPYWDFRDDLSYAIQMIGKASRKSPPNPDRIHRARADAAACFSRLRADASDARELVLSDENLLGLPITFFKAARFYEEVSARIEALAAILSDMPVRAVLVIRDQGDLYASAYAQRAKSRAQAPFAAFKPALLAINRTWYDVVTDIRAAAPHWDVTVIDYRVTACLYQELTGQKPDTDPPVTNESPSAAAIAALNTHYDNGGVFMRETVENIMNRFPRPAYPPLAPWTETEHMNFARLYARDLAMIAEIPDVVLHQARAEQRIN